MRENETVPRYVLRLALTLLLITGAMAAVLAGVHHLTAPRIAEAQARKTVSALSAVLPDADTAVQLTEFPDETGLVSEVYRSGSAYGLKVTPAGFDNTITLMVGVGRGGTVLGVCVISHTETPNLGATAADPGPRGQGFRAQFEDERGTVALKKDGGHIDAITGATITSRAVVTGVNAALACVAAMEGGAE